MRHSEDDVPDDEKTAVARDRGGRSDDDQADAVSTTGVGRSEEFVGRVAGDDEGYAGQTGAEARAEGAD